MDDVIGNDQFVTGDDGEAYQEFTRMMQARSNARDKRMQFNPTSAGIQIDWGLGRDKPNDMYYPKYTPGDALFADGKYDAVTEPRPRPVYEAFGSDGNNNHIIMMLIVAMIIIVIICAVLIGIGFRVIRKVLNTLIECHRTLQMMRTTT